MQWCLPVEADYGDISKTFLDLVYALAMYIHDNQHQNQTQFLVLGIYNTACCSLI